MKAIILLALVAAASASTNVIPPLFHPMDYVGQSARIVGGSTVSSASAYPHQVGLFYNNGFTCGGSLINNRWVLTAAHCIQGRTASSMSIRCGSTSQTGGTQYQISRLIVHESYGNFMNDIGLMQTSSNVAFGTNVAAIGLASSLPAAGSTHTVTGWGRTSNGGAVSQTLKQLNTQLQTASNCCSRTGICHAGTVCFFNAVGQGTCNGDSGGPCISGSNIVALVNFGVGGCASGYPDGMASVPHYRSWILGNIGFFEEED